MKSIDENIRTKPEPLCPNCLEKMVLRIPRPDQQWKPFWGCSQYPQCKGTIDIGPDGLPIEEEDDYDELDDMSWHEGWPGNYGDR